MYLNDLASVVRAGGMNVIEVGGWTSRNHGSMAGVRSVVCHHTAGAATGNAPSLSVVINGRSDLAGPLAQLFLARDGTVYVVSNGVAWHAGPTIDDSVYGNSWAIGIEAENTGTQPWPDVQVDAYAKLCAILCAHYGLSVDRVKGHKEICKPLGRKVDPAGLPGDMNGLRDRIRAKMASPTKQRLLDGDSSVKLPVAMDTSIESISLPPQAKVRLVFSANTTIFGGLIEFWGPAKNQLLGTYDLEKGWRGEVNQGYQIDAPLGSTKAKIKYSCASEVDVYIQAIA